jgi:hypothetical protein
MPVIAAVVSHLPPLRGASSGWQFVFSCTYTAFGLAGILANQFGLDRHGVKVLLLLPIHERTLLRGKLIGFAAWSLLQALVLVAVFAGFGLASADEIATGIAIHACLFVIIATAGMPISIWTPVAQRSDRFRTRAATPIGGLVMMLALALAGALLAGVLFVVRYWLPAWELAVFAALLVLLLGVQQLAIAGSARYLQRRREHLVELLSATG